jgi:glycosyltransferase involved in cell wall biosynthesis
MPRYVKMLSDGMKDRGHEVDIWQPSAFFYKLAGTGPLKKWFGYIDQYLVFPVQARKKIKTLPADTIFVFTDHALGPWVPLVKNRPHLIHCHDFLAQRSALGEFPENHTGFSGRLYQAYIRRGYKKGKNFISISGKTREDLHKFLTRKPSISELVYNGLNKDFEIRDPVEARQKLGNHTGIDLSTGYILHVGGNQWYKNRTGVIEIYNALQKQAGSQIPLLLVGSAPDDELKKTHASSPYKNQIHFLTNINDDLLKCAYTGAHVLLFPSLAEGFGWPIAEAMAAGCPVITSNEPPMTEVAASAAFLIARKPADKKKAGEWAIEGAKTVVSVLQLPTSEREKIIEDGLLNVKRFSAPVSLDEIEKIYKRINAA